jgi:plastocyanin
MNRSVQAATFAVWATGMLLAGDASAVDVRGTVRASEEPKAKAIEAVRAPYWHEWNGFIEPKKAAVDYAREVTAVLVGAPELRDATAIALRDGTLSPSTIVVQHGTTLRIRNEDDFAHELYVEGLKGFDAVATSPGSTRTLQMEQTGVFTVRDKVSPHVRGTLHVVAKVTQVVQPNAEGVFVFKDVPAGKYVLKLYRGANEVTASELEVASNKDVVLDAFSLDAAVKAKPGK